MSDPNPSKAEVARHQAKAYYDKKRKSLRAWFAGIIVGALLAVAGYFFSAGLGIAITISDFLLLQYVAWQRRVIDQQEARHYQKIEEMEALQDRREAVSRRARR